MPEELTLKSGWIKIDRRELDKLRDAIRKQYTNDGGNKPFNSHLPNYEELRDYIRVKLNRLKQSRNVVFSLQGQILHDLVPGNTFFKDFFYTKKDVDSSQFQEFNIDICYLYVYGKSRMEIHSEKMMSEIELSPPEKRVPQYKFLISCTLNNMIDAEKIKNHLKDKFNITSDTDIRNSFTFTKGSLVEIFDSLGENEFLLLLMSRDYLQNESCVKELIDFTKSNLETFALKCVQIILSDLYSGDYNIFDSLGRSEIIKYWMLRYEKLEENHKLLLSSQKDKAYYQKLRNELDETKLIATELHRLIDFVREKQSSIFADIFLNKITSLEDLDKLVPSFDNITKIDDTLETTYKRIKIPSNNDPENPEFPPEPFYKPKFPASATYPIEIKGFDNVWIKDESTNPTGTHKDRMAWEVVIKYKTLIESLKYNKKEILPQMSIISSGGAAIAIQHMFNLFKLPTKLKVLVDKNLKDSIKKSIIEIGCELYEYNLRDRLLSSEDIKEITHNESGIDITYREVLDPTHDNYYDWLSYEIIREKPDYCFIPFGTGDLFINVLNIVKMEYFYSFAGKHDPRFFSSTEQLTRCHFLAATTSKMDSMFDKLYSSFLPSRENFERYIIELREEYCCVGNMTGIYNVSESHASEAIKIAENAGINFEPSAMAGLALLLQMRERVNPNAKILVVSTGRTKMPEELI